MRQSTPATLEVVWNHRWEYDKGPERLLAVVKRIYEEKLNCRLHIVGQQFKQAPEEFAKFLRAEIEQYARVVKASGMKAEMTR